MPSSNFRRLLTSLHVRDKVLRAYIDLVGESMGNKIVLACEKCGSRNYTTHNHKDSERLELKKFCKNCNVHTTHRETK